MRAVQGDLPGEGDQLRPQIDFRAATAAARVLKEEEPFGCIRCGKPFGVKSTIERVAAKLEGKHWMFKGSAQPPRRHQDVRGLPRRRHGRGGLRSLRRAARRRLRTTEDYLREREEQGARRRSASVSYFVAFSRNFTSASRSSAEPMVCSGILVPGV